MVTLLPPQLPFGQPDRCLHILLSLQQDSGALETLPAHISQLGPTTNAQTHNTPLPLCLSLGCLLK